MSTSVGAVVVLSVTVLLFLIGFVLLCVALFSAATGAIQRTRATVASRSLPPVDTTRQRRTRRLLWVAAGFVVASFVVSLFGQLF